MRWEVQTWSLCGGWENCWHLDDELQTFATFEEAEAELAEHIAESERLLAQGERDDAYCWDEFRIVEIKE